jgi:SAM-dependent methyltransferase
MTLERDGSELTLTYSTTISPNENMAKPGPPVYFEIGLSALDCIRTALAIGHVTPASILDFACGYGRVCRMLRAAYPTAHLTAYDLDPDGVDFCASQFGAEAAYFRQDLEEVLSGRHFDLIWCGSFFTHLDRDRWPEFLRFFSDRLSPDGVLVFTTHGRQPIRWMLDGVFDYGLTPEEQRAFIRGYVDCGFGFVVSPNQPFGISLSSMSFVCAQIERWPSLKLIGLHEAGWASHQDVFACQRLRTPYPSRDALITSGHGV